MAVRKSTPLHEAFQRLRNAQAGTPAPAPQVDTGIAPTMAIGMRSFLIPSTRRQKQEQVVEPVTPQPAEGGENSIATMMFSNMRRRAYKNTGVNI